MEAEFWSPWPVGMQEKLALFSFQIATIRDWNIIGEVWRVICNTGESQNLAAVLLEQASELMR